MEIQDIDGELVKLTSDASQVPIGINYNTSRSSNACKKRSKFAAMKEPTIQNARTLEAIVGKHATEFGYGDYETIAMELHVCIHAVDVRNLWTESARYDLQFKASFLKCDVVWGVS